LSRVKRGRRYQKKNHKYAEAKPNRERASTEKRLGEERRRERNKQHECEIYTDDGGRRGEVGTDRFAPVRIVVNPDPRIRMLMFRVFQAGTPLGERRDLAPSAAATTRLRAEIKICNYVSVVAPGAVAPFADSTYPEAAA
jgi:hypothetical protein